MAIWLYVYYALINIYYTISSYTLTNIYINMYVYCLNTYIVHIYRRLYDEGTKTLVSKLVSSAYAAIPGHSNRIFSLKYLPDDPNVFLSGGWDNNIVFWVSSILHK